MATDEILTILFLVLVGSMSGLLWYLMVGQFRK